MYRILTVIGLLMGITLSIQAQNNNGKVELPESLPFEKIIISESSVSGNKLTKNWIILRELDFKIGDTLSTGEKAASSNVKSFRFYPGDSSELFLRMKFSRDNIINTKLFLTVDLGIEQIDGDRYRLKIKVSERHYWWMFPVVKLNAPNFNEWIRDPDAGDLSMGLFFSHNNLFGISHQTSLVGYIGKSYAAAFGYRIPWIGEGRKTGLTVVAGYQNLYTVEYDSEENERKMLYESNSIQSAFVGAILKFRPGLYNYGTIKLTGEWLTISDSLYNLNPEYLAPADDSTSNMSLSFYADYSYDNRNSKSYPLTGTNLKVFVNKIGLGLLVKDVDYFYYGIDFHFYQKLSRKWYVAEMVKLENSSGQNHPYHYQLNMTGKHDFIRGFDLYTLKGDGMYYFRSNIKYELVKPSKKKVKEKNKDNKFKALQYAFYLNAFADCGYVVNKFISDDNTFNNRMLYSWGLGLDFVTYYDMVLRFEYSFIYPGWGNGFYFGFGMPI